MRNWGNATFCVLFWIHKVDFQQSLSKQKCLAWDFPSRNTFYITSMKSSWDPGRAGGEAVLGCARPLGEVKPPRGEAASGTSPP